MNRLLVVSLFAWSAAAAPAAAGAPGDPVVAKPEPDKTVPAASRQGSDNRTSAEDEELIRNLDLIENLDLLDTAEALRAVSAPETPEEEF